jgi:hypothetical protein
MFQTELVKSDNQKFSAYWDELLASCELQNPLYNPALSVISTRVAPARSEPKDSLERNSLEPNSLRSSVAEKPSSSGAEGDYSFVLLENGGPIVACSLLLTRDENGQRRLGYRGLGAATYFSRDALNSTSNNISRSSFKALTDYVKRLLCELDPDVIEFQDTLSCGVMSPVSQYLIANGGLPIASAAQRLNLMPSSRSLVRDMSKVARGSVQWGQRNLELSVRSDNLALYDYLALHDLIQEDESCGIAVSLWQSKQDLKTLMQAQLGFVVSATYEGRTAGSAVFACKNNAAQYLGCQITSTCPRQEIIFSLIWKGVMYAKAIGSSELTLDHHFDLQSENLTDFGGFGGQSVPRLKVLWHKI